MPRRSQAFRSREVRNMAVTLVHMHACSDQRHMSFGGAICEFDLTMQKSGHQCPAWTAGPSSAEDVKDWRSLSGLPVRPDGSVIYEQHRNRVSVGCRCCGSLHRWE